MSSQKPRLLTKRNNEQNQEGSGNKMVTFSPNFRYVTIGRLMCEYIGF